MTDNPIAPDPNPATAGAPAAAADTSPVPAPLTEQVVASAAAVPAAETAAPAAAEVPAAPAADPAKAAEPSVSETPSLLESLTTDKKPVDPTQAPAVDPAAKPGEQPNPEAPAVAPTYQAFEMPEGLVANSEKMEAYTGVLGKYGISQEAGQELVNLHADAMKAYAEQTLRDQHKTFNETRQKWANEVRADPELGGSGHQTAMTAIARMRDLLVSEKDMPAFNEFLRITGAGDHPQFLKLLHKVAGYFDEPPLPPPNPRPPKDIGKAPSTRMRDLYNKSAS
jgi:hypothetical protein